MQEHLIQLSLDDFLEKALKRDKNKKEYGCVIRALESLLESKATEEQWDRRFEDLSAVGFPNNRWLTELVHNWRRPKDFKEEMDWEKIRKKDVANIIDMFHEIESSETPMGNSLKRYKWIFRLMTQEDIKKTLLMGDKILLLTFNHLAHLGYDKSGNHLLSLSDKKYRENLQMGVYYLVFRFTSK